MNSQTQELIANLDLSSIPSHVGIIMDGNGRWAKKQDKNRVFGHTEGAKRVKDIVRIASDIGVKHLSLYAFSIENWARPSFEVSALMTLIKSYIIKEREALNEENVRFRLIGRREGLAPEIIKEADISTQIMEKNTGLSLNLCINYGGRAEIVDAVKKDRIFFFVSLGVSVALGINWGIRLGGYVKAANSLLPEIIVPEE